MERYFVEGGWYNSDELIKLVVDAIRGGYATAEEVNFTVTLLMTSLREMVNERCQARANQVIE